jgi:hypothetical protein
MLAHLLFTRNFQNQIYVFNIIQPNPYKSITLKTESPFRRCVNIQQQMVLPMIGISYNLGSRASGGAGTNHSGSDLFLQKVEFSRRFRALEDEQIEKMQQINRFIIGQNSVPGNPIGACRKKSQRGYTVGRR